MELTLHLGAHRTGSTAVEKTLLESRNFLMREGVAVWPNEKVRGIKGFGVVGDGLNGLAAGANFRDVWDEVRLPRLVICEENMLGTMQDNIERAAFYPDVAVRMARYRDFLPGHVARIGIGLRDYAGFWTSSYAYVLARKPLPGFAPVRRAVMQNGGARGWCDLIGDLRGVFPAAEIVVWTLDAVKADLAGVAARLTGVPRAGLRPVARAVNAALDPRYIPAMLALRARAPELSESALRAELETLPAPAPFALFAEAEQAALAARYARDVAALTAGYAGVRMVGADGYDR